VKTRPVEPSIYSQADFAARVLTKEPKTAAQGSFTIVAWNKQRSDLITLDEGA
jgi:hypothetical protein